MTLKRSNNKDEICYPFIYETSNLCDYEVSTDELCNHIGHILSLTPTRFTIVVEDLNKLQPLAYHLNGSIRGEIAIHEEDLKWLSQRYHYYQSLTKGRINSFVLPRGKIPAPQLHLARSAVKKVIRLMVRLDQEGIEVPDILHRFCNVMCNFFFVLAVYINQCSGVEEIPFHSKSYPGNKKSRR